MRSVDSNEVELKLHPYICLLSHRDSPSFDFAQDGELVEPCGCPLSSVIPITEASENSGPCNNTSKSRDINSYFSCGGSFAYVL